MPSSTNLPARPVWHLDPGPLRPLVDQFTGHLVSLGYAALTVQSYGDAARHFSVWLQRSGVAVARIDLDTCSAFASTVVDAPASDAALTCRGDIPFAPAASSGSWRNAGPSRV
jgi:hypothetical protein